MKIFFNLEYQTTFGEELMLNILNKEGKDEQYKMVTLDGLHWSLELNKAFKEGQSVNYYYMLVRGTEELRHEWLVVPHRLDFAASQAQRYIVYDHWIDIPDDSFMYSSALTECIMCSQCEDSALTDYEGTVRLKVRAAQPRIGEQLGLVGGCDALGNWDAEKALPMIEHGIHEWVISLDADELPKTIEFKFVILGLEQSVWENGMNRTIALPDVEQGSVVVYELTQAFFPVYPWKGAGTVIPVFSLRTEGSFGVGDFGDLKMMIDWCDKTKQRILFLRQTDNRSSSLAALPTSCGSGD